jgi:ribosomal protein S8
LAFRCFRSPPALDVAPHARLAALATVCSPRFDVSADGYEKWIGNLLPSRQFGHIVVTTSYGIMDHEEARRKGTGGKLLGFFY